MILVPFLSCWLHMMWMCGAAWLCLFPGAAMRSGSTPSPPISDVGCGQIFACCASAPRPPHHTSDINSHDATVLPRGFHTGVHYIGETLAPNAWASLPPRCWCLPSLWTPAWHWEQPAYSGILYIPPPSGLHTYPLFSSSLTGIFSATHIAIMDTPDGIRYALVYLFLLHQSYWLSLALFTGNFTMALQFLVSTLYCLLLPSSTSIHISICVPLVP